MSYRIRPPRIASSPWVRVGIPVESPRLPQERAGDDELAASVIDDLAGLQAGAAVVDDGVAAQQQRVAPKGMDVGVGGVPEAVLPFRNGADLLRRLEHPSRGARVRGAGFASRRRIAAAGSCRGDRQEQQPGQMPSPGSPHRRLPSERWRYTSNRAIPAATEALRDPVTPRPIGMLTAKSQASATVRRMPWSSPPTTIAVGPR